MDGLLLDTEDILTFVTNQLLHKYGRPSLPWSVKAQLQGRPGPAASEIFHAWAQLPIPPSEYHPQAVALYRQYLPEAKPLPGVETLLSNLNASDVQIALATSSHDDHFRLKITNHTDLFSVFPPSLRVLGDDPEIAKGRGKPAPDIYLLALKRINAMCRSNGVSEIKPEECLVFEDSVPGVEAGRKAGMRVVWCPHPELLKEYEGRVEDVLAGSAEQETPPTDEDRTAEPANAALPKRTDEGWAELLHSLKDFDYGKYGIHVPAHKL